MNKRDWFYIMFLIIISFVWYMHYENQKAVWNLRDDPRGCTIAWDDGTYTYKSRTVSLGTLMPGESKTLIIGEPEGTIDIDTSGIQIIGYPLDFDINKYSL